MISESCCTNDCCHSHDFFSNMNFHEVRSTLVSRLDKAGEPEKCSLSGGAGTRTHLKGRALWLLTAIEALAVMHSCVWLVTVNKETSLLLAQTGKTESSHISFSSVTLHCRIWSSNFFQIGNHFHDFHRCFGTNQSGTPAFFQSQHVMSSESV